jgi:histidinol-phosphatase (PHP family)
MSKLTDNHTHTCFSGDSDAPVRGQIEAAIKAGLSGITFTDHLDPDFPLDRDLFMFDVDAYFRELRPLQAEYKAQIDVRIGAEIGMRPDQAALLPALAAAYPFDVVIGSIHVVDLYDPYYPEYWKDYGTEKGLRRFFEVTKECVDLFDFYDTLGHIDYIFRYMPKDGPQLCAGDFAPLIDDILRTLIKKGKALEVNTAGWKYGLPEPHPCSDILKRYHELGGRKLTLGSDGHQPAHLAYDFDRVAGYLKSCGFTAYSRYIGREEKLYHFSDRT